MKASEFCTNASDLMDDRAASRDTEGERSMARCVAAFNALYGHELTETEGWQFMSLLKKARGAQGEFRQDDYEDDVAYCALAGESACQDHPPHKAPTISEYVKAFGDRGINTGQPITYTEHIKFMNFCKGD